MSTVNVRVVCRFRPINKRELSENKQAAAPIKFLSDQSVEVGGKTFNLDYVLPHDLLDGPGQQEAMYKNAASAAVEDVLNGYNGTIFAYGQTGSGKTHSMFGVDKAVLNEMSGIIPRSVFRVFAALEEKTKEGTVQASVQASFLEIYCEEIRDLLNPSNQKLKLRETPSKGVWVEGLTDVFVSSAEEALNVIEVGDKCRSVAATAMNAQSSRSHSVFILNITQSLPDGSSQVSRLNLADLAGSEAIKKTGATGQTLEEAKKINQSLSALGNCIAALTEARPYVPYRDSKLTHLLRESLGGNTKSTLIVCCSPHIFNLDETVGTLRFAQRAKTIKLNVKKNVIKSRKELENTIERLKKEVATLKAGGSVAGAPRTEEEESELLEKEEEIARLKAQLEDMAARQATLEAAVKASEAKEALIKGKFEQYVRASGDKLKFFQAQFDNACTMRDRYKVELERCQQELSEAGPSGGEGGEGEEEDGDEEEEGEEENATEAVGGTEVGQEGSTAAVTAVAKGKKTGKKVKAKAKGGGNALARAHEQVRELLTEKDEGLAVIQEMEQAATRLQEDVITRCSERDNLLERMSELEATVHELQQRNSELEKMLYDHITKDMSNKKFVKKVGGSALSSMLSKLTRTTGDGSDGTGGSGKKGWLDKKGHPTGWKRRWFVLVAAERKLVYYKSDTTRKAQGHIGLDGARVTESVGDAEDGGGFVITIVTSDKADQDGKSREYLVRAEQAVIGDWLDALDGCAKASLPYTISRRGEIEGGAEPEPDMA